MRLSHLILSALLTIACAAPLCAQSAETLRLQASHDTQQRQLEDERFTKSAQQMADTTAEIAKRHADRPALVSLPGHAQLLADQEALRQMCKTFKGGCKPSPSLHIVCTQHTYGSNGNYTSTTYCY